jgi:tricorn protease
VDGGILTQPEFAWWDTKGGWAIENHGVDPDMPRDNLPQELARGVDAQLDLAIAEVMKRHQANPPIRPVFPPAPIKTREAYAAKGR